MILKETKSITIDSDIEGIKGGISEESFPFMFNILSKSYYSRKIDSIIREIASNCYDSHIEAGVSEPIIIEKRYDVENDSYSIVFKDVGIGMSPERVYNVFNNWFTSTKRDTNDFIGAFGLGSKSPFAYRDDFYITTIYNGLKYEYIYVLTSTLPNLISLNGYNETTIIKEGKEDEEDKEVIIKIPIGYPTKEHNGTEIIIPLINNSDSALFEVSIKKELCYFNDVFVLGFNINNDYKIYRNKTFLYRPNGSYSDELHIVLGQCCYPIDWKAINRERVKLPFGIIFYIGELQVNPNRESIIYDSSDDNSISDLINKKIDLVLEEVNDLLSKNGIKETDDLKFYLDNRNRKPSINFDFHLVYIPVEYIKNKKFELVFKPLAHLDIKIPENPFFYYEECGEIDKEVYKKHSYPFDVNLSRDYILIDSNINKFTNAKIEYARVIKKINIKNNYITLCEYLGLYVYNKNKYRRQYDIDLQGKDLHYDYIKNKESEKYERLIIKNKAFIIREYIKIMDEYIKDNIKLYSSFTPDETWISNYKQRMKENSSSYKRKINGEVPVININGRKVVLRLSFLQKFNNVVYYIAGRKLETNDDVDYYIKKLNNIKSLSNKWHQHFIFIGVASSNFYLLKDLDNLVHIKSIKNNEIFIKYDQLKADYDYISKINYELDYIKTFVKKRIIIDLEEKRKQISNKFINVRDYPTTSTVVSDDIIKYCNVFEKELEKLDILNYIARDIPLNYAVNITSRLKSLYLKDEYLGSNGVKPIKEEFNQNLLLL